MSIESQDQTLINKIPIGLSRLLQNVQKMNSIIRNIDSGDVPMFRLNAIVRLERTRLWEFKDNSDLYSAWFIERFCIIFKCNQAVIVLQDINVKNAHLGQDYLELRLKTNYVTPLQPIDDDLSGIIKSESIYFFGHGLNREILSSKLQLIDYFIGYRIPQGPESNYNLKGIDQDQTNSDTLFSYPWIHKGYDSKGYDSIVPIDLKRLDDGEFINDNIINFYHKYLIYEKNELKKKLICFHSSFYDKLQESRRPFQSVKRWTKNVDIYNLDFILIPCNLITPAHWFVTLILYPSRLLELFDEKNSLQSNTEQDPESNSIETNDAKCYIFICDSLNFKQQTAKDKMKDYVVDLITDTQPHLNHLVVRRSIKVQNAEVPMQSNGYDCGVYSLLYLELFMLDPYKNANTLIENGGKLNNWFQPSAITEKRKQIKNLIQEYTSLWKQHSEFILKEQKRGFRVATDDDDDITVISHKPIVSLDIDD